MRCARASWSGRARPPPASSRGAQPPSHHSSRLRQPPAPRGLPVTPCAAPQKDPASPDPCPPADVFGNRYFENNSYQHNRNRWVVYKDLRNYSASSVPAQWHGWLHYIHDTVPGKVRPPAVRRPTDPTPPLSCGPLAAAPARAPPVGFWFPYPRGFPPGLQGEQYRPIYEEAAAPYQGGTADRVGATSMAPKTYFPKASEGALSPRDAARADPAERERSAAGLRAAGGGPGAARACAGAREEPSRAEGLAVAPLDAVGAAAVSGSKARGGACLAMSLPISWYIQNAVSYAHAGILHLAAGAAVAPNGLAAGANLRRLRAMLTGEEGPDAPPLQRFFVLVPPSVNCREDSAEKSRSSGRGEMQGFQTKCVVRARTAQALCDEPAAAPAAAGGADRLAGPPASAAADVAVAPAMARAVDAAEAAARGAHVLLLWEGGKGSNRRRASARAAPRTAAAHAPAPPLGRRSASRGMAGAREAGGHQKEGTATRQAARGWQPSLERRRSAPASEE